MRVSLFTPHTIISTATVLAAASAPLASAQETYLEEVIVSAQKVEQDLQSVPLAVSSFGAAEMRRRNITRLDDVAASVPNLVIRENTGLTNGATIFLRGVGEDDSRIGADPAVAVYIDDQYYGRQLGAMLDLVEIERVEVLRGPQGTLYGRNSNGGAVKVYTRRPGDEFEFSADVTYGDWEQTEGRLRVSGPLGEDVAGQLAFGIKQRDGFYEGPGISDDLGEVDSQFFLAGVRFTPGDWDIDLKIDYTDDESDPNISVTAGQDWRLSGPLLVPNSNVVLGIPGLWDDVTQEDVFSKTEIFGVTLIAAGEFLGYDFKSITGYRDTENELLTRLGFYYEQDVQYTTFSQEFQLSDVDGEGLDWVTGLYYYNEEAEQDTQFFFALSDMEIDVESIAAFGQLYFNVNEATRITLGGRVTSEDKDLEATGLDFGFNPLAADDDESETLFDYRVALDYSFNDDVMVYGSVTTGSKAFGWSSDSFDLVDTEEVTTFEVGLRSEWPEQHLRLNLTAFINQYDDLQINGTLTTGQFSRFNVDEVETKGVELEATWSPTANLRIDANLGWQDGEYEEVNDDFIAAVEAPSESAAENLDLKNLPELTARLGVSYDIPMANGSRVNITGDYSYSDEYFTLLDNVPTSLRDDVDLFNGRISWVSADEHWNVAVWGKNLTDEEYIVSAVAVQQYPGYPRTYGLTVGYDL